MDDLLPPLQRLALGPVPAPMPTSPQAARPALAGRQVRRDAASPYARPTPASPEERLDATAPRGVDTCGDESDLSEDQTYNLAILRARWRRVLADFVANPDLMENIAFDAYAFFNTLQADCDRQGFRACASLDCPCGVWLLNEHYFSPFRNSWRKICKTCQPRKGKPRTVANSGGVEDEAMGWLKGTLEGWFPDIEVVVLPELRHADFAVRFQDWPEHLYLPVQLKSSGAYKSEEILFPNNREQDGRAKFQQCDGYEGLAMMFVKTRMEAGHTYRTLWWAWGEHVKTSTGNDIGIVEHKTGVLGSIDDPKPLPWSLDSKPPELETMLRNPGRARLQSFREIWLDVRDKSQRKEMAGMLAMEQVGEVKYPKGYSTAVDCLFRGQPTQVKTYNPKTESLKMVRGSGGANQRPYSSADGIQQLVELVIVKSGEAFYLLYAMQQLEALIEHGVFAHGDSPGQKNISVPLGPYKRWLTGKRNGSAESSWLLDKEHGFCPPVRLRETDYLSRALLEEVAYTATNPEWMPASV